MRTTERPQPEEGSEHVTRRIGWTLLLCAKKSRKCCFHAKAEVPPPNTTAAGLKGGPEAADKAPKQSESASEAGLVGQEARALGGVMRRIRTHLTYANVMVTILAFLVLGGGTALASYVISSNSQVGPNTISGHHPSGGAHPNLIAGSVGGKDVADDSLTKDDIKEATVEPDAFGRFHDAL